MRVVAKLGKKGLLFLVRVTDEDPSVWELPGDGEAFGCSLEKFTSFPSRMTIDCHEVVIKPIQPLRSYHFGEPPGETRSGRKLIYRLVSAGNVLGLKIHKRYAHIPVTDETRDIIQAMYEAGHLVGPGYFEEPEVAEEGPENDVS